MGTPLPPDPVDLESTICGRMRDIFNNVPLIAAGYARVETRERFPDSDESDIEISTVPDPINSDIPMTSLIQIGIPTIAEKQYTNDKDTMLELVYPITFDLKVTDKWERALSFGDNSSALAKAIYMQSRREFKFDHTTLVSNRDLGFENCVHNYLQQETAGIIQSDLEDDSGESLHVFDWSLTVFVTGILN